MLPYPLHSGQQVRVHNKLLALRDYFETTFLGLVPPAWLNDIGRRLAGLADEIILLPLRSQDGLAARMQHGLAGRLKAARSGLRASNHIMNEVELSPRRVATCCDPASFDLVLYEYWHTCGSTQLFQQHQVPCVLDMHDMLWRVVERRLRCWPLPEGVRQRRVQLYRQQEEVAWQRYDALIAINRSEQSYVQEKIPGKPVFYTPMGIDLARWNYRWEPAGPPRLAFYGAMSNLGNQNGVRRCVETILPRVWQKRPETEFWIIGGNPPADVQRLTQDPRIHVTGFVADVAATLATMTAVLCPWQGQFGFRSRLIEVMATGAPVVASPDAVYGMDLAAGEGLFLADSDDGLATHCLALLNDPGWARQQSLSARRQIEEQFSFAATYGVLARALVEFACEARPGRSHRLF